MIKEAAMLRLKQKVWPQPEKNHRLIGRNDRKVHTIRESIAKDQFMLFSGYNRIHIGLLVIPYITNTV